MTTIVNDDACIRNLGGGSGIGLQDGVRRVVRYTEDTTLVIADSGSIIECDSAVPMTITIPAFGDVPYPVGMFADIVQIGAGSVTVVGDTGVTVESNGFVLDMPDSMGYLYRRDAVNDFVFSSSAGGGIPDGGTTNQALLKQSSDDGDATWQTLTKSLVGLSNVDNTPDLNKPVSVDQAAADTATLNSAKAYADAMTTGLLQFIGNWSASGGLYPTTGGSGAAGAVVIGDVWRVSVAGTMGGVTYRIGDSFYATSDTPAQDPTKWASILLELGYNPEDVANKVTAFSSPTNAQYPSAKLVKDQLDLKLNDVTNGTGTGATQVRTPSAGTREIARIGAASTDVVVTQGATGAPNTIGLNGTTLKYWAEDTQAITSTIQRLIWQPKDPNGTYVRANTVQVIAVPKGLTLRDPSESGSTFPVNFRSGLDLQVKGATGTTTTFATGGYAFGEGNTAGINAIAVGIANTATGDASYAGITVGVRNAAGYGTFALNPQGVAIGTDNVANNGITIGFNNNSRSVNTLIGNNNSATNITGNSMLYGSFHTANAGGRNLLFGGNATATAANSKIYASAVGTTNPSDQGINGFEQFGRVARIPMNTVTNNISDWTNTAWRDVALSTVADIMVGNSPSKFSAEIYFKLNNTSGSAPIVPTRLGILEVAVWRDSAGLIPTIKVLQGGDANFLTYFDFQLVAVGTGVKLQWKFASDPSGGSANYGTVSIYGNITTTSSYSV